MGIGERQGFGTRSRRCSLAVSHVTGWRWRCRVHEVIVNGHLIEDACLTVFNDRKSRRKLFDGEVTVRLYFFWMNSRDRARSAADEREFGEREFGVGRSWMPLLNYRLVAL